MGRSLVAMISNTETPGQWSAPSLISRRLTGVSGSVIRQMLDLVTRPGVISFAGGLPASEAFDVEGIRAALNEALDREPVGCLQYGATNGVRSLREAICELMRTRGVDISPDGLIITTGSQQAITLVTEAILDPGDVVALENPSYPAAIQMAHLREARIITARSDDDGIDVDELEHRICQDKPKLLYLVPTFGNPSGTVLSLERRLRILELAVRHNFLVLEDDPYSELYFTAPPPPALIALAREIPEATQYCLYCSSLSKIVSPGIRVGWLIAPAEILRTAEVVKQSQDAHTSTLVQHLARFYLQSDRLSRALPKLRELYRARAETMQIAIETHIGDSLEYAAPQGGMFLWGRLNKGLDSSSLLGPALQNGVAFVPGASFMAEQQDPATMRLSYAAPDRSCIPEGIARLAATLKGAHKC